ncbi:MAG TPA: STAS domain-containing protein [Pseudonocardiaceae bacterium]|jgi:anti-anti-sigma factor|nr:STAS domain-containing protein [Pseudonocardiaceae bacterium]
MDDDNDRIDVVRTTTNRALILRVTGDIDMVTVEAANTSLRAAAATLPPPWLVVLDLTDVGFFGAAGVRLLRQWIDGCAEQGIRVHVVVDPASVALRVFRIVGLDEDVPTFPDLSRALDSG